MIQTVKKILAPIDFSEYSMEALRAAMELAKDLDGELHIVHVVTPHFALLDKMREQARETLMVEESEEELARIRKDDCGNSAKVFTQVMVGPPVPKLVEYAAQQQIDLILLATHGRTGIEHLMIGSVAEKLVRAAPCSVLVFRRRSLKRYRDGPDPGNRASRIAFSRSRPVRNPRANAAKPTTAVCVEFQLTRRLGSEIIHCNAVATDRSRSTRAGARVRRSGAPVSPLSVRCDSDIGCRTPCSPRASVRGRSGSKTRFDPDTRAGWFRSAARRKHANGALREWS